MFEFVAWLLGGFLLGFGSDFFCLLPGGLSLFLVLKLLVMPRKSYLPYLTDR